MELRVAKWVRCHVEHPERYKLMTLATNQFIRRFLMHVLPEGFHRIRYYGLLACSKRADNIARARELLAVRCCRSRPSRPPPLMPTRRNHRSIPAHAAAAP
jgi:hypothetical protein